MPNAQLAEMVTPMLKYVLPVLIGYTGGKMIAGDRGSVIGVPHIVDEADPVFAIVLFHTVISIQRNQPI